MILYSQWADEQLLQSTKLLQRKKNIYSFPVSSFLSMSFLVWKVLFEWPIFPKRSLIWIETTIVLLVYVTL